MKRGLIAIAIPQQAAPPDGTYFKPSVIDAQSKQIQITSTNSNYAPVGQ